MLTQKRLKEVLHYSRATGVFRWRSRAGGPRKWNTRFAGIIAGHQRSDGYVLVCIDYKRYYGHHLAWLYVHGVLLKQLDHCDLDPSNNRIGNLRRATNSQNMHNSGRHRNNSSGFKGVRWHKRAQKWDARIRIGAGERLHLGLFNTAEAAHAAYCAAAAKHHGEFSRTV